MPSNKQDILWLENDIFYDEVRKYIQSADVVLDVGCGIRPQQYIVPKLLICIEPYHEYAEILKQNFDGTNTVIIQLDAKQALSSFPDKSTDTIFLIDVIEHMTKEVGHEVIKECERVARGQVVIFTPLGYMPQEIHAENLDAWNLHGGSWQEHKSGWYPEDFPFWKIIACKHLHKQTAIGERLDTPYGGFFAIKSLPKSANHFNDVYAQEILESNTNYIKILEETFPNFIEQVVKNQIAQSSIKCAINHCQRITQLLMGQGTSNSLEEIFKTASSEKNETYINQAREFIIRINKFAAEFKDINVRGAEPANDKINELQTEIVGLHAEIIRLNDLISKNIWSRIYAKFKRILKR